MATTVASPPRGASLRALNPFGGATTSVDIGVTTNCRNYLWTFAVLLIVWALLAFLKPKFVLNTDGTVNYQRIFWITLGVSVVVVLGLCFWSRRNEGGFLGF